MHHHTAKNVSLAMYTYTGKVVCVKNCICKYFHTYIHELYIHVRMYVGIWAFK